MTKKVKIMKLGEEETLCKTSSMYNNKGKKERT
jgi:hypothetical protein